MKAILVFDVNEFTYEAINDYFAGDITLHLGNDGFIDFKDVILQPMPQKKEITDAMIWNSKYESRASYYGGYNACIDEILGEENE